ncbi:chain-length determining protein [Thiomicrospira microaerophila]|uniref:chain-length determining protein n=1 Tax=Thiomicrospira microaerophila TaxID=406020 RepID=UPI0005CAA34F|nr:chain-length determining protein [Thiomicrospira microaerophila]
MTNTFKPYWYLSLVLIFAVGVYWHFFATDRYVSQSHVVLESPKVAMPQMTMQSMLTGTSSGNKADMLLLRDHLLSVDMLKKLDAQLNIRQHYTTPEADYFTRLSAQDLPIEKLHDYMQRRIKIELDEYAQLLRVRVEAFTPEKAQKINEFLLKEGEAHMNEMGKRLAQEQINFLEQQLKQLENNFDQALQDLLDFQNKIGLVSPQGNIESISGIITSLQAELAKSQAKKAALSQFQSAQSSEIIRVESEIQALTNQINIERQKLAQQSGEALNAVTSQFQILDFRLQFARESYSAALAALEGTRIEAARTLKQVSVLQSASLPEYAIEPRRLYNSTVFAIVMLFLTLIAHMVVLIIKDHKA